MVYRKSWSLWNDICRCCMRVRISWSLWEQIAVTESARWAHRLSAASDWVAPGWEAEKVVSGVLKITQCGMVKRRSYGSILQFLFVTLSIPFTQHRNSSPLSWIKCESFIKQLSFLHAYISPKNRIQQKDIFML